VDPRDGLIVALDTPSLEGAEGLADRLRGAVRWFKVGSELYTAAGPTAVAALRSRGRVFLDLKFHDIPTTVAGAVAAAARHGADLCTVHAAGGAAMMRAAQDAAARTAVSGRSPLRVIAVTLLTSGDERVIHEVGIAGTPLEVAVRLGTLAREAGLSGVVASPLEVRAIKAACGPDFLVVCPGIRLEGGAADDQRRVLTPGAAVAAGADMLVVGRPITRAPDPREAAEEILRQMRDARRPPGD